MRRHDLYLRRDHLRLRGGIHLRAAHEAQRKRTRLEQRTPASRPLTGACARQFLANVVAQLMDNDADGVADAHVVAPSGLLEVNTGTLNLGTAGIQALVSQAPWTAPASTWTPSVVPDGSYAGNGMAAFGTSVRLPYPPPKPPSSPPLTPPGVDVAGVEMSAQNSLSDGALIGIGIGCAGLAVLLLLFVWRAKKAKAKTARPNAQSDVELPTVSQSHSTS